MPSRPSAFLPFCRASRFDHSPAMALGQARIRRMIRPVTIRAALVAAMVAALALASTTAADRSSDAMARAAIALVKNLEPAQAQQAAFPFESAERMQWHFIPTELFPRKGLLVRDMNPKQRALLHDLLKTALSQRGYLTATSIMDLETVLK